MATAITRNKPVTLQLRNDSEESRSSAIVGNEAETIVIDEENTVTAAMTVSNNRRG